MIASHYAQPLERKLVADADFFAEPGGIPLARLNAGTILRMLDKSRGWAWGYGPDGRVGYIRADAVG